MHEHDRLQSGGVRAFELRTSGRAAGADGRRPDEREDLLAGLRADDRGQLCLARVHDGDGRTEVLQQLAGFPGADALDSLEHPESRQDHCSF